MSSGYAFAGYKTDSLLIVLKNTVNEKDKTLLLLNIAGSVSSSDSVIFYNRQALYIADKINNDSLRLACYRNLIKSYQQKPYAEDSALVFVPLVDKINTPIKFPELSYSAYASVSALYTQLHQYDLAIKYSQLSFEAAILTGDVKLFCKAKNSLGETYRKASLFEQAMEVFKEASEMALKENDLPNIISAYRGIAICYDMTKDFANAEKYFQLAFDYALKAGIEKSLYVPYSNLAVAQWHLKKYDAAINNIHKAVAISIKYNIYGLHTDYKNLADVYKDKGDLDSSIFYGNLSLTLAEKNNERLIQLFVHKILSEDYKQKGDYKLALEHSEQARTINDTLKVKEREKAIADAEATYKNKESKARIELLNKENEIHKLELKENESELYYAALTAEKKESELALLNKDNDLQALQLLQSQQELANRKLQNETKTAELALTKKDKLIKEKQLSEEKLFRNLIIVGTFSIIVFGLLLFNRFRLRKQLEAQKALTTQRKQISADLHDDIGATLSSISIYSEAMKSKVNQGDYDNAVSLAEKIGTNSREMMDNMSDIVWAINPGHDSLQQVVDRMVAFASGLLAEKNIKCKFDFDEQDLTVAVDMDARKNIYLIFKEAINNIAKYSQCSNVMVQVKVNDKVILLKIVDDGKGFATSPAAPIQRRGGLGGNGIKNMHQRAEEINAQLDLTSEINRGTVVSLQYPLVRG